MAEKVNKSVSKKDNENNQAIDWARKLLGFTLGNSEPDKRVSAIQQWLGGQNQVASLTGLSKSTFKSWSQGRVPQNKNLTAFVEASGISAAYLTSGLIENLSDLAVEEVRFNIARSDFLVPSGVPERREARRFVIDEARAAIERARLEFSPGGAGFADALGMHDSDVGDDEFDGMVLVPRLSVRHGLAALVDDDTAPIGFRADELARLGVDIDQCGLVTSPGDEMAPTIGPGATVLIDVSAAGQRLQSGRVYAFILDGNLVLRRYRPLLGGAIELVSDNSKYGPEQLPAKFDLASHVAGRAVWTAGSL